MNFIKLYEAFVERKSSLHSFRYRHRSILKRVLKELPLKPFPLTDNEVCVAKMLSECPFAYYDDFPNSFQETILKKWARYPKDPNFYKMLLSQDDFWKENKEMRVDEFLKSAQGVKYIRQLKKRRVRPVFPHQPPFRQASKAALRNERRVVELLRRVPLLRYSDLKFMGIKNAQKIIERYSFLETRRKIHLKKLKTLFDAQ